MQRACAGQCVGHFHDRVALHHQVVNVDTGTIVDGYSGAPRTLLFRVIEIQHLILVELVERHVRRRGEGAHLLRQRCRQRHAGYARRRQAESKV